MKILRQIGAGTYGIAYEEEGGGAGGEDGTGLPQDQGGEDGGAGLPKDQGEGAQGGGKEEQVTAYNFETDTSKLGEIDLQGTGFGGGKFKSVADLDKGYIELETFKGKKSEDLAKELGYFTPETYDFGDPGKEWDDDTKTAMTEHFKGVGLSQEQSVKAIPMVMELAQEIATLNGKQELMEKWNLTGAAFDAKESEIVKWAQEKIPQGLYADLAQMGANGLLVAESMMRANNERPMWNGASNVDTEGGKAAIIAIEAKMAGLKKGSAEYTQAEKERQKLYKETYSG